MLLAMTQEDRRRLEQLTEAIEHRTIIGIAMGIAMERLDLDADAAFAYLRGGSSHQNRKIFIIASEIAASRILPEQPP